MVSPTIRDVSTLPLVELRVLGPVQVRQDGKAVTIPGAKSRAILTMLGLHDGSVVAADVLIELLWGEDPPRTAAKALQTHVSSLRRTLGDGVVVTEGTGWTWRGPVVDAARYKSAAKAGREAAAADDTTQAVARFEEALALWRGIPELPDGQRGASEKTRWIESHAALVEDRADALLATGRAAEIIGELEGAVADAPLRERRWGQLMLALYRAGRQGEALRAYQRARVLLADELGVDPGPDLRRLEAAIVAQDSALEVRVAQQLAAVTRTVTFLLTDIVGSTAAWEADADAMAVALARHDELVEQIVTSRGGRLIKTRGEGDATFSVFERPSGSAAAAIELQEAIAGEPWALRDPMRIRVALHTGEVELRDGDYFGRAVNRAARLRSLAEGGQILCSGATAELVIDSLPDDVMLADLGMRELRNLARPEHVFELRLEATDERRAPQPTDEPLERPSLPAVLAGPGPFVGRGRELDRLCAAWHAVVAGGTNAVLIAGEPGVGKTRLAGEWSRQAYDQGAVVIYGRCDEDLGAPYQPFAEALRSLVPCLRSSGLRGLRGVEALLPLVPALADVLPDLAAPTRADPDTERYALFDAVVALFGLASTGAPLILILDDLHWAAKPTLLLLRHLLRFGEHARVQVVGTYRSTDLDRSHPLAAMLADLHRSGGSGTADRLALGGLDEDDVSTYVAEAGYDDEELARALASVTGGNPFFLIEALRHVDESGGRWDASTLPQGVREAVSRRLSRLAADANKALSAAAVVGSRFALELVERVVGDDLVDAFDEACKAGIVIEEPSGRYRFNHAIVRQSLLAELPSVRRMRLHQRIAVTLENEPGADDELLAELAHHYFECAWAGNAAKAVEYCRRAADQAMARLAYEGAADLYHRALHALEEIDQAPPDRADRVAELLVARCEALLAGGDVASATGAVSQLQSATVDSARLAAWATCFDGQLSMLIHPERLDEVEAAVGAAAAKLADLNDAAGEAKAHTVRAGCLARLGRIGDCEIALDDALTAARRGHEHRAVNAVLAGAPLAALWGPNPVPRAGGRCLDVVRLLRITTDSPAVEATSTRCQAVLEAFRGRAAAARRMIDSARRTVSELGLRHALLEVEQFAGIVELVVGDPAAAEPHLRQAYNGFRRMGLDADTAETAALLGRTCLALDRDAEALELCAESGRLAGHALKPSIAWRTLSAHLLSRGNDHAEARLVAEAAVSLAERTDLLVDHGDACASLATVLGAAGDATGARAAAERAVGLYERKGAAALAERARDILGDHALPVAPAPPEAPIVEPDNLCVRMLRQLEAAITGEDWAAYEALCATEVSIEGRRKIVGFPNVVFSSRAWVQEVRRLRGIGAERHRNVYVAVRGERLALSRLELGTRDASPGAPQEEVFALYGLDAEGRIALCVFFDIDDLDAAIAELDATHARFEEERPRVPLENGASRAEDRLHQLAADRRWDEFGALFADDIRGEDRRRGFRSVASGRATVLAEARAIADLGAQSASSQVLAMRGDRLALVRIVFNGQGGEPEADQTELLRVAEIDSDNRITAHIVYDPNDFDSAIAELDTRYLAGEAAAHAHTWSVITRAVAALNRRELPSTTLDFVSIDHRRAAAYAPGELIAYVRAGWELDQQIRTYVEVVHRLSDLGAVVTHAAHGSSREGFDAEWRGVDISTVDGEMISRSEVFDEADLDAALSRFDQLGRQAPQLKNAASQTVERSTAHFAARDWDALAKVLIEDVITDDRRRVVNSGIRRGRDALLANVRTTADTGTTYLASVVIAARGERLILARLSGGDHGSGEFLIELLAVVEVNADYQVAAAVLFDPDDFASAMAELDMRYLAGEAAVHAHAWSVIRGTFDSVSRYELPAHTPDWMTTDHRRDSAFTPGELTAYIRAGGEIDRTIRTYAEAVHRLSDLGGVCTFAAHGISNQGLDTEWRGVSLTMVDGDMVNRTELYDETDLDTAIARFDQLSLPARRLENAVSRLVEQFQVHLAGRDWDALADLLADDVSSEDRRRVINAGIRLGRDGELANWRATSDVWTNVNSTVVATRGERLALLRFAVASQDQPTDGFDGAALAVIEINADNRAVATVVFDIDDFEAAIAELEARYVAGDAAAHSHPWSLITGAFAAINRRELPEFAPNWVNMDRLNDLFDDTTDINVYIEAVHRLSNLGAVITQAAQGTSQQGCRGEWRKIAIIAFDGDLLSRCEPFDEADLEAAIATFDQPRLSARLANSASRSYDRYDAYLIARNWDAMAGMLADDVCNDDRRRVVRGEITRGRDAQAANSRAIVDVGVTNIKSLVIATRGESLVLTHTRVSGGDQHLEAFGLEMLNIIEIDTDGRIAAGVQFDLEDIDAAFSELDARYLVGEAAAQAHTWSAVMGVFAALNRHEQPSLTTDSVCVDRRPLVPIEAVDLATWIRGVWDLTPDLRSHIETVHRLSNFGAVVAQAAHGTSQEGFGAEWRLIAVLMFEGDRISRLEVFDEADVDAAIARFDELQPQTPRLENAATQVAESVWSSAVARDWDAIAELLTDDIFTEDRRRVVGAGIRPGRDALMVDLRAIADMRITNVTSTVTATRGERLVLMRVGLSFRDHRSEGFLTEVLAICEVNRDARMVAAVSFDCDDIDDAFEELDRRYLAGEAAAHTHTWSVIARAHASFNRHELPATAPDSVYIDHRPLVTVDAVDLDEFTRATWHMTPDVNIRIEAVHSLTDLGAVITNTARGVSDADFDAEWRMIEMFTVEGELVNRCEIFDEADLNAALARFDELGGANPIG
jgi:DNA-binding SARP family transcriptional activator